MFFSGYDEFYTLWGREDDDLVKRFELLGLKMGYITDKTSYLHQWHKKFMGLGRSKKHIKKQVKKNDSYFNMNNSIIRNPDGWGELDS